MSLPAPPRKPVSSWDASPTPPSSAASAARTSCSAAPAGQLHYRQEDLAGTAKDKTIVEISTDADRAAEMQIELKGLFTLTKADFIL